MALEWSDHLEAEWFVLWHLAAKSLSKKSIKKDFPENKGYAAQYSL